MFLLGTMCLQAENVAACVMIDAISRFVPGVLNNEESSQFESMQDNLLEYPHYTRTRKPGMENKCLRCF